MNRYRYSDLGYAAVSGTLLGIGFYFPSLWFLVFVGLVPFWHVHWHVPASVRRKALRGLVLGVSLYGWAIASIHWHTLPIEWYGIESGVLQVGAVIFTWFVSACVLSVGTVVFAALLPQKGKGWQYVVLIPLLWVLGEIVSALSQSVLLAGPGSLLGAHFTMGYVGYLLAHNVLLLQLASLGGVYILSFVAVLVNMLIYRTLTISSARQYLVILALVVCATVVLSGHMFLEYKVDDNAAIPHVSVAVVSNYQPARLHLSAQEEQQRVAALRELVTDVTDAQVLLMPESSALLRSVPGDGLPQVPLIVDTRSVARESGRQAEVEFLYQEGVSHYSAKQFILPLGEYLPYFYRGVVSLIPSESFRDQVGDTRSFRHGTNTTLAHVGEGRMSVRFCDESMSPALYARDVRDGAQILANVSSYSWFHGSKVVFGHMQLIAKVRAVESGRWYVQSGNMAPAFVLDHRGRVVAQTLWHERSVLVESVPLRTDTTLYTRLHQKIMDLF